MIHTVLGEIAADDVTGAYLHEHLIIESLIVREQMPHIYLDNIEAAVAEVNECKSFGVNLFVDCMPGESGRSIEKLKEISNRSNTHIVAATGMHNPKYYQSDSKFLKGDREFFAEIFTKELSEACGLIKIHSLGERLSPLERELFAGAVEAQKATGAPILTHCEDGTGAIAQITEFENLKANLSQIVLSHTDKNPDFGYHREILASGVNVEYDQSLRQKELKIKSSLDLTVAMCNSGFTAQIMLGTDGARRSLWRSLGGSPGLAWLASGWRELLESAGLSNANLDSLFRENPRRFLTWNQ